MKRFVFLLTMVVLAGTLSACSKGVDANKSIDDVRAEAPRMSKGALEKIARQYADAIYATQEEYRKAALEITAVPYEEKLGKKAVAIKERAGALSVKLTALNLHYDTYLHYYLEKGGDYEKIKLRR